MDYMEIKVGIADLKVARAPDRLITIGLGSCVGIVLFDRTSGIGGLAHIMLPDSKKFSKVINDIKFADLAIPILVNKMKEMGANARNLRAKIAGGASMFNFSDSKINMDIGERNSKAVKEILGFFSIPLESEDVGGTKGRTITFDTMTGALYVRTVGEGTKTI
ncbi:chemotaxis protein CheD [Clostridium sp. UBA4548]|uniref:chemotaxis protein CheD n=1 Tax=Clostridium sp. UBA4548 TaxID=1946361 RepID=UPI0025B7BCDF|nr:chemotaxis protein CheD [Clostridium sp. UBA4548]